ncbi:hypothetical protein K493DRAFT_318899 [Basidiobolus meristosporus CBS 931.73]|uniref:Uncharacterized protein n=1 Tax=Basidiobolus meristosporus CBS 931.73 TaxID=1314790 RepID=A0A1Y1XTW5_9FUNG|nr:hypothetical protein K493DRAFT_318899 [Basidiobolus meristosporus CBS 931.73]|eukprot:ORX89201.1 hypothetical protein K493DRAFT_318899 [Basidiobolus meristosporus CBS 931.73]
MHIDQSSPKYLAPIDVVFQHLETEEHPMTCTSVWTFKTPLDECLVTKEFCNLVDNYPKFRQCIHSRGSFKMPEWVDSPDFKLENHLHFVNLTGGTKEDVAAFGAERFVKLDPAMPLWNAYVINDLKDGGSALIVQAHHALSDGIGFLCCTLSLTSARDMKFSSKKASKVKKPASVQEFLVSMYLLFCQLCLLLLHVVQLSLWELRQLFQTHLILRKSLPLNPKEDVFKKSMSWSEPVDLEDVKLLRRRYNCTVNDILTTILTLAIRNYLSERSLLHDKTFRFLIPISVRRAGDLSLSNQVGGSSLFVPIESSDPSKLLSSIQHNMHFAKNSVEPLASCKLLAQFSYLPQSWYIPVCSWYAKQYNGVFTNIPGPQQPLRFAGQEIDDYVVYPPQTGPGGLGMGVISYNNKVVISVLTDETEAAPQLAKGIAEQFKLEFDRILNDAKLSQ